ncbi:YncE family protein [Bacillus toyonensis]|uniref:YncE family protein n=1 Tax=Bacillus toyonensis TaxID=155322 RepID=UPI0015D4FDED|nr:YncE family protein [Bacillus toyonensis]
MQDVLNINSSVQDTFNMAMKKELLLGFKLNIVSDLIDSMVGLLGPRVYIDNNGNGSVSAVDVATFSRVATISGFINPRGMASSPTFNNVYVVNSRNASVSAIDADTNSILITIQVGAFPIGAVIDNTLNRLYVANHKVYVTNFNIPLLMDLYLRLV